MNNGPLLFLGLFVALVLPWSSVVLSSHVSEKIGIGKLMPHKDEAQGSVYPGSLPGRAAQGLEVYQSLGCATCHTQQVRAPHYGTDKERGWGEQQSVAREYIQEPRVLLGEQRLGPDLRNVGARLLQENPQASEAERAAQRREVTLGLLKYLYAPRSVNAASSHPPYPFLFETRRILGQPSQRALPRELTQVQPGYEVVPSSQAEELAAYLLSLKTTYTLPEAKPYEPKGGHGAKAHP